MQCEKCEAYLEITSKNFKQDDGGQSFSPEFGSYYWFEGDITCSECGHVMHISDQNV